MFQFLEKFPWPIGVALIITIFIACSSFAILMMRRFSDHKRLQVHHDVAAVVFTNLGVLYSVLLGFTVVNVQQRFDQTNNITHIEASQLAQLYLDSKVFSESNGKEIRDSLINYGRSIIDDEWETMRKGERSELTDLQQHKVWEAYYNLKPDNNQQVAWYSKSIDQLNKLMESRIMRLLGSQESLSDEMWCMLIIVGVLMVGFICFFGLANTFIHLLMGGILSASIAALLFLIYSLDTAFEGVYSIEPAALENAVKMLQ